MSSKQVAMLTPNDQLEWVADPRFGFAAAKPPWPQPQLNMVLGGTR